MRPHEHGGDDGEGREETFRRLYAAHVDPVLGYALRRVARPEDAADVVAETFLVAWRRLAEVPAEPAQRPWLYGVARRVLANQRRGALRRGHLGERLRVELAAVAPDHAGEVAGRLDTATLLAGLPASDREVLELAAWEGLEPREIAAVVGSTPLAVRTRLSRARKRLRQVDGGAERNEDEAPGHPPVDTHPQLTEKEGR